MAKKRRLPGSIKFSALYFVSLPLLQLPIIGLFVGLWVWLKSPQYLIKIEKIQLTDAKGEYAHWHANRYAIFRIGRHAYLWVAIMMTTVYVGYGGVMILLMYTKLYMNLKL